MNRLTRLQVQLIGPFRNKHTMPCPVAPRPPFHEGAPCILTLPDLLRHTTLRILFYTCVSPHGSCKPHGKGTLPCSPCMFSLVNHHGLMEGCGSCSVNHLGTPAFDPNSAAELKQANFSLTSKHKVEAKTPEDLHQLLFYRTYPVRITETNNSQVAGEGPVGKELPLKRKRNPCASQ